MTLETDAVGSDGVSAQNASAEPNSKRARRGHMLTVQQIVSDRLTMIAQRNWALDLTRSGTHTPAFDPTLVADIYHTELKTNESTRLMLLEFSGYLENYLWPNFDARTSSVEHILSIMMIVNEKFRESVPAWDCFQRRDPAVFNQFFQRVIHLRTQHALSPAEKRVYIIFLIRVFQSLENELLRKPCLKLVSLPLWRNLNPKRRQRELKQTPELEKHWKYMEQQAANGVANAFGEDYEMSFFPSLVEDFLETLQKITPEQANPAEIRYCEHFVEFLIDIESQLPTRRFTLAYLEDTHIIIKCERSELIKMTEGSLFGRLIEILKFYLGFEINVHTGLSLTEDDITAIHSERLVFLQRLAFKEFRPALTTLAMSSIGAIESRSMLMKHLSTLSHEDMVRLGDRLMLLGKADEAEKLPRDILLEIIVSRHEKRMSQIETINEMPLYPDENLLWDFNLVPDMHYYGDNCLALPKLNLQFLTFHDYLLRNFNPNTLRSMSSNSISSLARLAEDDGEEDDAQTPLSLGGGSGVQRFQLPVQINPLTLRSMSNNSLSSLARLAEETEEDFPKASLGLTGASTSTAAPLLMPVQINPNTLRSMSSNSLASLARLAEEDGGEEDFPQATGLSSLALAASSAATALRQPATGADGAGEGSPTWVIKNTFLDFEPARIPAGGLRSISSAAGRLDALAEEGLASGSGLTPRTPQSVGCHPDSRDGPRQRLPGEPMYTLSVG